jgi:hypothetical protein
MLDSRFPKLDDRYGEQAKGTSGFGRLSVGLLPILADGKRGSGRNFAAVSTDNLQPRPVSISSFSS